MERNDHPGGIGLRDEVGRGRASPAGVRQDSDDQQPRLWNGQHLGERSVNRDSEFR